MTPNAILLPSLRSDIKTTAMLLGTLKRATRASGHHITWHEARELHSLKHRATRQCALRAHLRGRTHRRGDTLESQAAFVDEDLQLYSLKAA